MKKLIPILLLMVVLISSLTACGQSPAVTSTAASPTVSKVRITTPQEYYDLLNGKNVATITMRNSAEYNQKIGEEYFQKTLHLDFKYGSFIYVDSLTDGLLMLRSHKIDVLRVMGFTGNYLIQRTNDLKLYVSIPGGYSTQMIFSAPKQAQYEQVNAALKAMQTDGSLQKLIDQWITNLPVGGEPSGGKLPEIQGAETIKVGISGDEPPLDYIAADGVPGGFNVAVLAEISRRVNINIALVTVVSGARFAALQSGKIDAFLWHNSLKPVEGLPSEVIVPQTLVDPNYLFRTISYLDDEESFLILK